MAEYINRDALLDKVPNPHPTDTMISRNAAIRDMLEIVLDAPAADAAPVVHARWIDVEDAGDMAQCSECGECYDCTEEMFGAFMDGEAQECGT